MCFSPWVLEEFDVTLQLDNSNNKKLCTVIKVIIPVLNGKKKNILLSGSKIRKHVATCHSYLSEPSQLSLGEADLVHRS